MRIATNADLLILLYDSWGRYSYDEPFGKRRPDWHGHPHRIDDANTYAIDWVEVHVDCEGTEKTTDRQKFKSLS